MKGRMSVWCCSLQWAVSVKGPCDPGCDCGGLANLLSLCVFTSVPSLFFFLCQRFEGSICVYQSDWGCSSDPRVLGLAVFFEPLRSVALLLGVAESSSAWVNDDKDDDSLYSRAPRVATLAWLKATSAPSFVYCVCASYCQARSLSGARGF